jgi:hypothetical protein
LAGKSNSRQSDIHVNEKIALRKMNTEDHLKEKDKNLQVAVRVRPLSEKEKTEQCSDCVR